jgi:hypothetical protein
MGAQEITNPWNLMPSFHERNLAGNLCHELLLTPLQCQQCIYELWILRDPESPWMLWEASIQEKPFRTLRGANWSAFESKNEDRHHGG